MSEEEQEEVDAVKISEDADVLASLYRDMMQAGIDAMREREVGPSHVGLVIVTAAMSFWLSSIEEATQEERAFFTKARICIKVLEKRLDQLEKEFGHAHDV